MTTYTPEEPQFDWAVRPGRLLQRELDAREISQAQLAARTGLSTKHINLVIKGNAALSPDVAVTLEQILGTSAETWLRMEAGYQAHEARIHRRESLAGYAEWAASFPRDILVNRGVIAAGDSVQNVVSKLLDFFAVATPMAFKKTWIEPQASYKRSQLHVIDPNLTALWLRLAETQASLLLEEAAPEYDAARLRDAAARIPALTVEDIGDAFRHAQGALLKAGVALVFVPEIKSTRICGVSKWIKGHPMIAVTSRYRTFDSFWFTLLHEIGHVLLHPKRGTYIDYTGKANDNEDAHETAANEFAEDSLVPREYRSKIIAATTPAAVIRIAKSLGVSPGVIAGQRAFLTGEWGGPTAKLRSRGDLEEVLA